MIIETRFRSQYGVEIATELPSSGHGVQYFPELDPQRGRLYEAALKFTYMDQASWWGVFAARSKLGAGLDLVSSMPDPEICCVTTWGTGYLVNVRDPNLWQVIDTYPVLGANAIVDLQLIVINDFTNLAAYGADGLRWRVTAQCSDELKVRDASSERITYTGWDAASDQQVTRYIDPHTGNHVPR